MSRNRDRRSRPVVGQKQDSRRESNKDAVRELVALCLKPGVSLARAAMDHALCISRACLKIISGYSLYVGCGKKECQNRLAKLAK